MDDKSFNIRVPKKWARVGMIVMVTALIVAPLTAIASHSFTDVPDSNTFHEDIAWLADADVTKGCNPPANTEFCPADEVTRGQMAAFMRRFSQYIGAEDGTPAEADNADTLDGKSSAVFVEEGEADSVTSEMTTNEPSVAQTIEDAAVSVDSTTPVEIASVTVNAPSDGFVVVHATSDAAVTHVNGSQSGLDDYGVSQSDSTLSGDQDKDWILDGGATAGLWATTMAAHKIFPVSAGSNTFYLLAARRGASPAVNVADTQLSAVFYATSSGTVDATVNNASEGSGQDSD